MRARSVALLASRGRLEALPIRDLELFGQMRVSGKPSATHNGEVRDTRSGANCRRAIIIACYPRVCLHVLCFTVVGRCA